MSWRDQLREARLDEAEFSVRDHTRTSGRRLVVHEYPFQELPETEDMGGKALRFQLEAYVLGDGYLSVRDRLQAVLDRPGVKQLVHPYFGDVDVVIEGDVQQRETTAEGGMARFSFTCLRAGSLSQPAASVDSGADVQDKAFAADEAAAADFAQVYAPTAYEALKTAIASVHQAFEEVERTIGVVEDYADLAQELVLLPQAISTRIQASLARLSLPALRRLFGGTSSPLAQSAAESANNAALQLLVQAGALTAAARLAAGTAYASYDQAVSARDELVNVADGLLARAGDALYNTLTALLAAVSADITARAADLRRLTSITLAETAPAVVLAHRLYGVSNLEANSDDLVARNGIAHALFIPGGVALEVLSP